MMKINFDNLPNWHRELFNKMLNVNFQGNNEIRYQLEQAQFEIIDDNRSMEIFCGNCPPANVVNNIPVEIESVDFDGIVIHGMLFVSKGKVYMFEILKEDASHIVKFPEVDDFEVIIGLYIPE